MIIIVIITVMYVYETMGKQAERYMRPADIHSENCMTCDRIFLYQYYSSLLETTLGRQTSSFT